MVCNFTAICLSACLSVCMYACQTITFESLDVRSSFSFIQRIAREYWSSLYMKVIRSSSKSHEQKRSKICIPAMKNFDDSNLAAAAQSWLWNIKVCIKKWHTSNSSSNWPCVWLWQDDDLSVALVSTPVEGQVSPGHEATRRHPGSHYTDHTVSL